MTASSPSPQETPRPIATSDDEGYYAYVEVGPGAETGEQAIDVFMATVERDGWLARYDRDKLGTPARGWWKWGEGDEHMVPCDESDPDADREVWQFVIAEAEIERTPPNLKVVPNAV